MKRLLRASALLVLANACGAPRPSAFVNIAFTPSVDTHDYRTWRFELASCRGFGDPRIDDAFVHAELLSAIESVLDERGYELREEGPTDFTVFYRLWVRPAESDGRERLRGQIVARDVATRRLVWAGERKAPVGTPDGRARTREEQRQALQDFARELLQYTSKLEDRGGSD